MKRKILAAFLAMTMLFSSMTAGMSAMAAAPEKPVVATSSTQKNDNPLRLWYNTPAKDWQTESLVIGNGYLGGMVFGGITKERVHYNEKTMWTGGPSTYRPNYDGGNRDSFDPQNLETFRQKLDDKTNNVFGVPHGDNSYLSKMWGDLDGMGAYQDFGDIYLDFARSGITDSGATNYVRDLDMETAISSVSFSHNGVHYNREYFTSYPDNVMVMRLTASEAGKLTFDTSMDAVHSSKRKTVVEGDKITVSGEISDNQLQYESQLKVINEGGSIKANDNGTISVDGADSVVIVMSAGTDYKNEYPTYRGEAPHAAVTERVDTASIKSYDELLETHLTDYQELFSRVDLDLDAEVSKIPTDQLVQNYRKGEYDKALDVLIYQFGRYLTIAGSREGSLPTNLAGLWTVGSAAWGGDYHFNVNVQMNYWPTLSTNLAECATVFNDYMESLRKPGRVTAAMSAGVPSAEGEENGFLVHTQNNPFGMTAPSPSQEYGWNITGSSWALQNVYDYYRYTGDETYLKDVIYPMMKEQSKFWQEFLWYSTYQDRMVVGPSVSAEQGPTALGTTYDQSLVWQLFEETIDAAEILNVDADLRAEWKALQDQLKPIQFGDLGQIKEWYEETTFGRAQAGDLPEIGVPNWEAGYNGRHRHSSHLIGLYPGTLINKDNKEYMDGAMIALNQRGFDATGWSKAHKINMWARTGDSANTYKLVQSMIAGGNAGILTNLLDSHGGGYNNQAYPIFQIDGNFGLTAGMTEMLIQSQLGYTQFLPTVPKEWATGSVTGLVARGNFVVDMAWSDGSADEFIVTARDGGTFIGEYAGIGNATIKTKDGVAVDVTKISDDKVSFETTKDQTYVIDFNTAAAKLEAKVAAAKDVAAQMTDDALVTAKRVLDAAISHAEQMIAEGNTDQIKEELVTLDTAIKTANKAVEVNASIALAQQALMDMDNGMYTWYPSDLYVALKSNTASATTLLADATATYDAFVTANAKMTDALDILQKLEGTLVPKMSLPGGTVADGTSIVMTSPYSQLQVRYTIDGTEPTCISTAYTTPLVLTSGITTVKAALFDNTKKVGDSVATTYLCGNIATTATVTASNIYGAGYEGNKAADGKNDTRWATSDGTKAATLDFAFEQPVTVGAVSFKQYSYTTNYTNAYNVEYWDGSNWIVGYTGGKIGAELTATFDPITSNKIRINFKDASNPSFWEVQLFKTDKSGSNNIAPKATDIKESNCWGDLATYNGGKAADGSMSTRWATKTDTTSATLDFTFENPVNINSIELNQYKQNDYPELNVTRAYNVEYWDGSNWVIGYRYEGKDIGAQATATFDAITSNKIRINFTDAVEPSYWEIKLFEAEKTPEKTNKTILKQVIASAQAAKESGEFAAAIPSVQASFTAALDIAMAVDATSNVTQIQVNQAWVTLMTEIHKLGFVAGNKDALNTTYTAMATLDQDLYEDGAAKDNFNTALAAAKAVLDDPDAMQNEINKAEADLLLAAKALVQRTRDLLNSTVAEAETYVENDYLADGWAVFAPALANAQAVQNNKKATQAEIDKATSDLVSAMLKLRYKPTKEMLEKILGTAEKIDVTQYTAETALAFQEAVDKGRKTFADPNATAQEIQDAIDAIKARQAELTLIEIADDGPNVDNTTSDTDKEITANGANGTTNSATTGDSNTLPITLAMILVSASIVGVAFKKRKNQ